MTESIQAYTYFIKAKGQGWRPILDWDQPEDAPDGKTTAASGKVKHTINLILDEKDFTLKMTCEAMPNWSGVIKIRTNLSQSSKKFLQFSDSSLDKKKPVVYGFGFDHEDHAKNCLAKIDSCKKKLEQMKEKHRAHKRHLKQSDAANNINNNNNNNYSDKSESATAAAPMGSKSEIQVVKPSNFHNGQWGNPQTELPAPTAPSGHPAAHCMDPKSNIENIYPKTQMPSESRDQNQHLQNGMIMMTDDHGKDDNKLINQTAPAILNRQPLTANSDQNLEIESQSGQNTYFTDSSVLPDNSMDTTINTTTTNTSGTGNTTSIHDNPTEISDHHGHSSSQVASAQQIAMQQHANHQELTQKLEKYDKTIKQLSEKAKINEIKRQQAEDKLAVENKENRKLQSKLTELNLKFENDKLKREEDEEKQLSGNLEFEKKLAVAMERVEASKNSLQEKDELIDQLKIDHGLLENDFNKQKRALERKIKKLDLHYINKITTMTARMESTVESYEALQQKLLNEKMSEIKETITELKNENFDLDQPISEASTQSTSEMVLDDSSNVRVGKADKQQVVVTQMDD